MKRLRKVRVFSTLALFGLVILAGFMALKTLAFSSKQIPVEPVSLPAPPQGAVSRLVAAIRVPTVSREEGIDSLAFR